MGWLRWVGSIKLQVSFAEYHLFYRALLQKRPIILRSLLIVATPYKDVKQEIVHTLLLEEFCVSKKWVMIMDRRQDWNATSESIPAGKGGPFAQDCYCARDLLLCQRSLCCSVLQRVAVCCSVLQCVAVCCSVLQCVAVCCSVLQCVAVCCSVLQCVAVRCGGRCIHFEKSRKTGK